MCPIEIITLCIKQELNEKYRKEFLEDILLSQEAERILVDEIKKAIESRQ